MKRHLNYTVPMEKIDILLATYNGEKYIAEQLHSLLNQTYQNFNILIRDDGSKDHTPQILEDFSNQYPSKIRLLSTDKNLGIIQNFSLLMQEATSEYMMFCDQDDVWHIDKISKTLSKMKSAEEKYGKKMPLLVHTNLNVVNEHLELLDHSFWNYSKISPSHCHQLSRLLMQNAVTGCTMLFNRSLLKLAHPVPLEAEMHDWWLAIVASVFGKIESLDEPTIFYRQHSKNSLGAQKFCYQHHLKKNIAKLESLENRKRQANIFLNRYKDLLTASQLNTLCCYIDLNKYSWFNKRLLIIKHGFWRNCFFRNLITLLLGK